MAPGRRSHFNYGKFEMDSLTLLSPAKINLMLSVHGSRGDGFHVLTSLVVALEFGDRLRVAVNGAGQDRLICQDPAVPTGDANLIIRAAEAFRARLGDRVTFDFDLDKCIPMGAGLGGGSSNAAVALVAMNDLTGACLDHASLLDLAAELGSDCPFFIDAKPARMTGRGEVIEALPTAEAQALRGQRVILFCPNFGVNTAWAYRRLIDSNPCAYESEADAIARLNGFSESSRGRDLLYNSFESPVGRKYLAIPCMLDQLRTAGHACLMSGSGSCSFAIVENDAESAAIRAMCLKDWGSEIFFIETSIS